MNRTIYTVGLRQKFKRYKTYQEENIVHTQSIISKYGVPSIAYPPLLPSDVITQMIEDRKIYRITNNKRFIDWGTRG